MAFPTMVNDQITDSITQTNVKVLGDSPSMAVSSVYQSAASSLAHLLQNAVSNQQNINSISTATTSACVDRLLTKSK